MKTHSFLFFVAFSGHLNAIRVHAIVIGHECKTIIVFFFSYFFLRIECLTGKAVSLRRKCPSASVDRYTN